MIKYIPTAEQLADIEAIKAEFAEKREALNARQAEERNAEASAKRAEDDYFFSKLRDMKREAFAVAAMYDARVNERNKLRNDTLAEATDDKSRAAIEYEATADIIRIKMEKREKAANLDDLRGKLRTEHAAKTDEQAARVMAMNLRHAAEQNALTEEKKHAVITYMQTGGTEKMKTI